MTAPRASTGNAPPALHARGVWKRFGSVEALRGVTLAVPAHACVALVGESGSGKTTLLRCFNRLVDPDTGTVFVHGRDVREMDTTVLRRDTGYVPQEGGLLPHWTVLRNVELVPRLRGAPDARARAENALAMVGLDATALGGRYPRALSGGQRQRVAMARALAPRPEVILLDEPFGALDAITRADAQRTFLDVRRDHPVTCVLVTHDLREAMLLADRLAVLRAGEIVQEGTPDEVRSHPTTPYVAELLARAGVAA
ncbi:MAG TPA: ATP-binding cassette domain-containing protein [Gemmatimonadaceae bacterium]|nr:ATP-binding cassette domain-containing protein [Gemmatimonadaceae bacterium]